MDLQSVSEEDTGSLSRRINQRNIYRPPLFIIPQTLPVYSILYTSRILLQTTYNPLVVCGERSLRRILLQYLAKIFGKGKGEGKCWNSWMKCLDNFKGENLILQESASQVQPFRKNKCRQNIFNSKNHNHQSILNYFVSEWKFLEYRFLDRNPKITSLVRRRLRFTRLFLR